MPPVVVLWGNTTIPLTLDLITNKLHLPPGSWGGDGFWMAILIAIPHILVQPYFDRLWYTKAAAERLHSYLLLSFEHAAELARTCAIALDLLPEVKGDKGRMDDIEANIEALSHILETQVGELLSWMETSNWHRLGKRRLCTSVETAVEELKKKIAAIERVKDDLKAIQQRIIAMQSSHDFKEVSQRKQLDRTLETVYARLDAARGSERATSDSVIPADGVHKTAGFDLGKDSLQSIESAGVRT